MDGEDQREIQHGDHQRGTRLEAENNIQPSEGQHNEINYNQQPEDLTTNYDMQVPTPANGNLPEDDTPLKQLMERILQSRQTQTFTSVSWNPVRGAEDSDPEPTRPRQFAETPRMRTDTPYHDRGRSELSPTDTLLMKMAESLGQVLKEVTKKNTQPMRWTSANRGIPYQYSGMDHEDPAWFLNKMNHFFYEANIDEDIEKINLFGEQLRSKAKEWFDANLHLTTSYHELTKLFLSKFDSPEEIADVLARLYGEKQQLHETAAAFISRKRRMSDRLIPTTPFNMISRIIINQLEPELRSRIRSDKITNYEELIRIATKIEKDLEEVKAASRKATPDSRPHLPPRNLGQGQPTGYQNTQRPNPRNLPGTSSGPPSVCRHCGEWHFHSQCPLNPYKGNDGGAERPTPTALPSARTIPPQRTGTRTNPPQQEQTRPTTRHP